MSDHLSTKSGLKVYDQIGTLTKQTKTNKKIAKNIAASVTQPVHRPVSDSGTGIWWSRRDPSPGAEDVVPDNVISGRPPLRYGIVHTGTIEKTIYRHFKILLLD